MIQSLSEAQLLSALLAIAVLLVFARGGGELARRLRQPEVLGELLGGFVLGPSLLGSFLPAIYHALFLGTASGHLLSGVSWIGAILLLLIGGMEVDLRVLRAEARPGILAAVCAIVPSLVAGAVFAGLLLGQVPPNNFFLGIVLSVTAISVVAKILIEREEMRRDYAQVLLAAGIASEMMVWLFVSVVSATHSGAPILAAVRSTGAAIAFFAVMLTVGRRFTFWAMRRVADATQIVNGQLTLVLVLTFLAAGLTQSLGLHALLGAFVVGVLLSHAPRTNMPLVKNVQTVTSGFFAPIFFALAGTRVDVRQLNTPAIIGVMLLLLLVATLAKVVPSFLGARLGGLPGRQAALVGVGLNLKGGTDVIVAIIGMELGLLTSQAYTMYAVVAMLTVLFSPPLLSRLAAQAPPTVEEAERLEREEAERRAYVPHIERVLVPMVAQLLPSLAASVVERMAISKHNQRQIFDITEFVEEGQAPSDLDVPDLPAADAVHATNNLQTTTDRLENVEITRRHPAGPDRLQAILKAAKDHDLIAIGAQRPHGDDSSFSPLHSALIHQAETDVLVVVGDGEELACNAVRRILVATNGQEYSMAAGDVAASLAQACDAELVAWNVTNARMDAVFWRERDHFRLREQAGSVVRELAFRAGRLGVRVDTRTAVAEDPDRAILEELRAGDYQLIVLGALDRGANGHPYLGHFVETVLLQRDVPVVVLVSHESVSGHVGGRSA